MPVTGHERHSNSATCFVLINRTLFSPAILSFHTTLFLSHSNAPKYNIIRAGSTTVVNDATQRGAGKGCYYIFPSPSLPPQQTYSPLVPCFLVVTQTVRLVERPIVYSRDRQCTRYLPHTLKVQHIAIPARPRLTWEAAFLTLSLVSSSSSRS